MIVATRLSAPDPDSSRPGETLILPLVVPLQQVVLPQPGAYSVEVLIDGQHKPLDLLHDFLRRYLADAITGVHILPFFPFTSDDGFAVTDYETVNSRLGDWADINRIGEEFRLMSDLVLNHMSSQSKWFHEYLQGHEPYDKYFFEASPSDDLTSVVRPRAHPLLREVETCLRLAPSHRGALINGVHVLQQFPPGDETAVPAARRASDLLLFLDVVVVAPFLLLLSALLLFLLEDTTALLRVRRRRLLRR